jgi:hypothetical protein
MIASAPPAKTPNANTAVTAATTVPFKISSPRMTRVRLTSL